MPQEQANAVKFQIPPLTLEEEDNIILTRITNDERPLKRVLKKFHTFAQLAASSSSTSPENSALDDARESFLVELASYQLSLKKSAMVCEAETRQVEEYRRERQRIEQEHEVLRNQIEELKVALEHAQMLRRRKIEYDQFAEKVNTLPTRDELEQEINALENDMATIRSEHEMQDKIMYLQKAAIASIVSDLMSTRSIGKDKDAASEPNSPGITPAPELPDTMLEGVSQSHSQTLGVDLKVPDLKEDSEPVGDGDKTTSEVVEDDIEMGEVEEEPRDKMKKKPREEELEEGEASDQSSELSEPPDD